MESASVLVVDGNNIFLRSYFGYLPPDPENHKPIWGIQGAVESIAGFIKRFRPTHVVVVFDAGRSAYRLEMYPDYKGNRPKEDLAHADVQLRQVQHVLSTMGIMTWSEANIEGDDVMARVCQQYEGIPTTVVSGDKDIRQLVSESVVVFNPSLKSSSREPWDWAGIFAKYGVSPDRLPEVWALCGDKGDNIPGVPYIGEKRAIDLIAKYGSLSAVALSEEKRLDGWRHQLWTSYKLVKSAPELSGYDLELDRIRFEPVHPDGEGSVNVLALLESLSCSRLKTAFTGNSLWQEQGKRLKDIKKLV